MTEPDNLCCPACGRLKPIEIKQPVAYHISFHAPAGICRDVVSAHSPQEALEQAKKRVETAAFGDVDFDPLAESYCVRQISVTDPDDGDQMAIWTEPDYFAEQHADEILDYLESIIEAADDLTEKRHSLDETISDIASCAEDAARRLQSLRVQGGAQ